MKNNAQNTNWELWILVSLWKKKLHLNHKDFHYMLLFLDGVQNIFAWTYNDFERGISLELAQHWIELNTMEPMAHHSVKTHEF
jgi:hypothetical protein